MSEVDVVVVTYRDESTLSATLAGLAAQTLPSRRVVVVRNAAAATTVATGFRDRLDLEIIEFTDNRGFSAAVNEGIRRTAAPWVLSLNPDCRLEADFLARLLPACTNRRRVAAAAGLLLRASGPDLAATDPVDSAGMVVDRSGRHHDRGAGLPLRPEWLVPAWVFGVTGAAALYRREALDDVAYPGGEVFDETFFAYREDADLAWRLQRRGWRCLYWPDARAAHERGLKPEAGRRLSPEINRYSVRNRFLLRWSNADWRWRLACLPAWAVRDALVAGACLTTERSSLPGLKEALALRAQQRRRGRANAARATVSGWDVTSWFMPWGRVRPLGEP